MRGDSTDTRKIQYGKASFLLVWNGSGGGFFWLVLRPRRPLEPGLDDRHRHAARGSLPGRGRLAAPVLGRNRPRQPKRLLRPDLQPRRQLPDPERRHSQLGDPAAGHRDGSHQSDDYVPAAAPAPSELDVLPDRAKHSGKCVDVYGVSTADGAVITSGPATASTTKSGSGLRSRAATSKSSQESGKCLYVRAPRPSRPLPSS